MKKIVYIAALVFVAASCQKEEFCPKKQSTPEAAVKSATEGTVTTETSTETVPDGNDITDPMRKKDKKGSK